jgi:heme-degrading monooxygenase HmoA
MIGAIVSFEYDGDFDQARVVGVAEKARQSFEGMPGLRFKFFTFDADGQRAVNFYLWESRDAADAFFTDELRQRVTGLYGVTPAIEYLEIAQIVDNASAVTG